MRTASQAQTVQQYVGYIESFEYDQIRGFAIDRANPSQIVSLRVLVDGEDLGETECTLEHAGLVKAREDAKTPEQIPDGTGGFEWTIPYGFMDGLQHTLKVLLPDNSPVLYSDQTGRILPELQFCIAPETMIDGHVDGIAGGGIQGWVVRINARTGEKTGAVSLVVRSGGNPVAQIKADLMRADVAQAKDCPSTVGFNFKPPLEWRNGRQHTFTFHTVEENYELRGSPYTTSFLSHDAAGKLVALNAEVEDMLSKLWMVNRKLKALMPAGDHTVASYDGWARAYREDLYYRVEEQRKPSFLEDGPLVSVICPTFRPRLSDFTAAVESVRSQTYPNWELIIVDDASKSEELSKLLRELEAADNRIKVYRPQKNRGISAATNTALRNARGKWIAFFDHDDLLDPVALEVMIGHAQSSGARLLYSDEDKIDDSGTYSEPNLKPDWNHRLLLSQNYICHLVLAEKRLVKEVGLLNSQCDGAQDHDFLLRACEKLRPNQIVHVPEILYHWRKTAGSTAASAGAKTYTVDAGILAVASHIARRGLKAKVSGINNATMYRVDWKFREEPGVTIIIPFKDQVDITRKCVASLLEKTTYRNYRIILVDNWSATTAARRFCKEMVLNPRIKIMRIEEKFNYSRLNNLAVDHFPSPFYCFLNNDIVIDQADWLENLVGEALSDSRVGAVGAKLLYPNGTIQHAGVILGVGGVADHAFKGLQGYDPGYVGRAASAQEMSAVTAACMLCRSEAFLAVGKFDERDLKVAFNDVDLCLKLGQAGWKVVYTPSVVLEHHESLSRGDDIAPEKLSRFFEENQAMEQRWNKVLSRDPFYSPHFSRTDGIFRDLRMINQKI